MCDMKNAQDFELIDGGFCLHYFRNCTTQFLGVSSIISTHCHNLCAHLHQLVPQKSRHPSLRLTQAQNCSTLLTTQESSITPPPSYGANGWAYDRLLDPSNFRWGWFLLLFSWRNLYFWTFNAVWISAYTSRFDLISYNNLGRSEFITTAVTLTLGNLGFEMQTLQMGRGFETPGFYLPLIVVFFKKAKCPCQSPGFSGWVYIGAQVRGLIQ